MSNGFFDQGGRWVPQAAPRLRAAVVPPAPEPEPETRLCAGCGDELTDVEWLFDPCPEDEDGSHRAAS